MSNVSGASSGSSSARSSRRVFGVPKTCTTCGEQVIELISRSHNNPYRRYFRCGYAVARKVFPSLLILKNMRYLNVAMRYLNTRFDFLMILINMRYWNMRYLKLENDNHTFKWVDVAHLEEIEALKTKNARIEEKLEAVVPERKEFEMLEKELFERVDEALVESSSLTKKRMIVVVILCMVMVGFSKLLG